MKEDKKRLALLIGLAMVQLIAVVLLFLVSTNRSSLLDTEFTLYLISFLVISCGAPGILLIWINVKKSLPTKKLLVASITIQICFVLITFFWGSVWYWGGYALCVGMYLLLFFFRKNKKAHLKLNY